MKIEKCITFKKKRREVDLIACVRRNTSMTKEIDMNIGEANKSDGGLKNILKAKDTSQNTRIIKLSYKTHSSIRS